jgi:hypothetical protein
MSVKVREMLNEDARMFLEVHHAAVHGIAAKDYPPEVVEDWAPMPVTDESVERFLTNPDGEIRLVAEIDEIIVVSVASSLRIASVLCSTGGCPQGCRLGTGAGDRTHRARPWASLSANGFISNCGAILFVSWLQVTRAW